MKKAFLGSVNGRSTAPLMAMLAASVAVAVFVMGPLPATGQNAPAKAPARGGAPGGPGGGKAPAAPPGPIPRTKEGKPDMSGFWGGVNPSGVTNIEPAQAKGGGKGAPGGPGGAKGGGAPGGGGAAKGGGAPPAAVAGPGAGKGGPGAGKGGPGGPVLAPGGGGPGTVRQNLIIDPADGRVPYTAAARAKSDDIIANRMFLEPELHCFPSGVPHNMWVQFGSQTIQTKDYVVFMWEFMHSRRIIPLDNRPHQFPDAVRQFQGEEVGHWEGDTLVVDTTNQTDHTWFDTSGHYAPKDIHVIERFTMLNSNQIEYEATITSATEFTQPMKLKGTIARANANDPKYEQMEFACIEGNDDLAHYTQDKGGKQPNVGARTK
jgi:hypothetical protein